MPNDLINKPCPICGFESTLYDRSDILTSQTIVPAVLKSAVEGPDGFTPTVADHLERLFDSVTNGGSRHTESPLDALADAYQAIEQQLADTPEAEWEPAADRGLRLLHAGFHTLATIGRLRHHTGGGATSHTGSVAGLHISDGGVPKRSVDRVSIDGSGVQGDVQADRRHHGRPCQAVCLWSLDVIEKLSAEGHPIEAGSAGENVAVVGVRWSELRPGSRVRIGPVPMLISAYAVPCAKNAQWFADRDFRRILHDRHPGWSRLYAIPLAAGIVSVSDPVEVEPTS